MEWEDFTRDSIYKISKNKEVRNLFEKVKSSKRLALSLKPHSEMYKEWFGTGPTEKLYNAIFMITEYPKCECGKEVKFESFKRGYRIFCSGKCAQSSSITRIKLGDTLFEKYGTRDPLEIKDGRKRGITKCNNSLEVKEKRKKTCIEKYGGETSFSSKEIQNKVKATFIEKYEAENPMFSKEFIDNKFIHILSTKRKNTYIKKYGVTHPMKNDDIKLKNRNTQELNGNWIKDEDLEPFRLYVRDVWRHTGQNDLSVLENIENRSREGYHLDHKYSIFQGYKDEISAEIIGNIINLEMLPSGQNLSKNRKCSISKDNLLSNFKL